MKIIVPMLAIVLGLSAGTANAQDAVAGKKIFKKCASCHKVGDGAVNSVGPYLTGVIGRKAGSVEGYKYGKHIVQAGEAGLLWTPELVADYITNPKKFLRSYLNDKKAKAKMTFKLKDEQARLDVIAYLQTFSPEMEGTSEQKATLTPASSVCVENASDSTHLFAAELGSGERSVQLLNAGETLCVTSMRATDAAVVSVYEKANSFEGCSRLINVGTTEILHEYSEFDRCLWSSNAS